MKCVLIPSALTLCASAAALASPTLQFDVNTIGIQARDSGGANSAFGGLTHTGSVNFSYSSFTALQGMFVQNTSFGPWIDQGFSGTLSGFTGVVTLDNGMVTGGSISLSVNGNSDTYSAQIVPGVGRVRPYVGGGYTVQGLTFAGFFSDALFGNVDVTEWFNGNGGIFGSFLEFNFDPNTDGGGFADVDIFADAVPLPATAWAGLGTMAGMVAVQWVRRRK